MGIKIGTVMRFYFAEAYKTKRSVVVAVSGLGRKTATLLLINTEMTEYAKKTPSLRAVNIPLKLAGRETYLDHDSYLSCDRLFVRDLRDLEHHIRQNPDCILGSMDAGDIAHAKSVILSSGRYSAFDLEQFGLVDEEEDD